MMGFFPAAALALLPLIPLHAPAQQTLEVAAAAVPSLGGRYSR